jgi:hypothetical protein
VANVCTICPIENRPALDRALADGKPVAVLARKYAVKDDALRRHKKKCLARSIEKAASRRMEARAETILDRLESLIADARRVADAALAARKFNASVSGLRTIAGILRTLAEMRGELGNGSPTINIALVNQQREVEQRLDRLSIPELREYRRLIAKMEQPEAIEVEATTIATPAQPEAAITNVNADNGKSDAE